MQAPPSRRRTNLDGQTDGCAETGRHLDLRAGAEHVDTAAAEIADAGQSHAKSFCLDHRPCLSLRFDGIIIDGWYTSGRYDQRTRRARDLLAGGFRIHLQFERCQVH